MLMPAAFVVYLLSAAAMAFWGPFDAPVARDTAGGAAAELSGVDRLLFAAGRRLLLVAAAAMAVPLFLGGGHGPWLPAWAWVGLKTTAVLACWSGCATGFRRSGWTAGRRSPGSCWCR
ncbi:hypothetical protein Pdca_05450 [Pseudonocardia autotrophica]|nr:hypothetical protein Pdca_05450 [Pseudonocardia autotrophica]